MVLIDNTSKRLIGCSLQKTAADPLRYEDFPPGISRHSAEAWEIVSTRGAGWYLEKGIFRVVATEGDLKKLSPEQQVALVKRTANAALLQEWRAQTRSKVVRDAIDGMLSELHIPPVNYNVLF